MGCVTSESCDNDNRSFCCALISPQATDALDAQLQASGQHRQQVAALQQAERELQAALAEQQGAAAQQEQQVLALQAHAGALDAQVAQLQHELHEARQQALDAEARLAKAAR